MTALPRGYSHHDPRDTEQSAAEDVHARQPIIRDRVRQLWLDAPDGLTDWEATELYARLYSDGVEDKNLVSSERWRLMADGLVVEARDREGNKIQRKSRFNKRNQVWRHITGWEQAIPLPPTRSPKPCPHFHVESGVPELATGDWVGICSDCGEVWLRAPSKGSQ